MLRDCQVQSPAKQAFLNSFKENSCCRELFSSKLFSIPVLQWRQSVKLGEEAILPDVSEGKHSFWTPLMGGKEISRLYGIHVTFSMSMLLPVSLRSLPT